MSDWLMGFSKAIADLVKISLKAGTVDLKMLTDLIKSQNKSHKAELFRFAEKLEIACQYKTDKTYEDYQAVINSLYMAYKKLQTILTIDSDVAKEAVDRAVYAGEPLQRDYKHCNATMELIRLYMCKFMEEEGNG
jgi:hypothetical protein